MSEELRVVQVVAAIITNERNEFLCGQRPVHRGAPLQWEFIGGKVEPGEEPEAALHREIFEETAAAIEITEALPLLIFDYPTWRIHLWPFRCRLTGPAPQRLWHADLRWVPAAELHTLDWLAADWPLVHQMQRESA